MQQARLPGAREEPEGTLRLVDMHNGPPGALAQQQMQAMHVSHRGHVSEQKQGGPSRSEASRPAPALSAAEMRAAALERWKHKRKVCLGQNFVLSVLSL